MHLVPPEFGRTIISQNSAVHKAFSPSPHRRWTSLILSADLQIPLQVQSKEATQTLPAWAFHSQSVVTIGNKNFKLHILSVQSHTISSVPSYTMHRQASMSTKHTRKRTTKQWQGGGMLHRAFFFFY